MIRNIVLTGVLAAATVAATASVATARTPCDGSWSLSIVTHRGSCDTYNFPVEINNGRVSFPGLVRANGRVTSKGHVRVFVAVTGKSASGSGHLSRYSGRGRWSGRSGNERCSGTWSAQRG